MASVNTPVTAKVGQVLTLAATGFASSHAITCKVQFPQETMSILLKGTTSGGAYNFGTNAVVAPQVPGIVKVTANDGTTTVVVECEVFQN